MLCYLTWGKGCEISGEMGRPTHSVVVCLGYHAASIHTYGPYATCALIARPTFQQRCMGLLSLVSLISALVSHSHLAH